MNRYGLKDITEAQMREHVAKGIANREAIAQAPDRMKALADLMARGDLIWAVWPETDKRKPKVAGHALGIAKGIPMLQHVKESGNIAALEVVHIWFDSHASACAASALYGDDLEPGDEAA